MCSVEALEGAHISFQQGASDLPHGLLDVDRCQLAVLAHHVPGLVQPLAEIVKHASPHQQPLTSLQHKLFIGSMAITLP